MKRLVPAFAAFLLLAPAASFGDERPKDRAKTVSATGNAAEQYPPDTVVITLAVETESRDVKEAADQNNIKAEKMINGVKKALGQEDTIKTASYAIRPVYEYDSSRRKQYVTGYRAVNQVTVRTKKVKEAGALVDIAVRSGANRVDGVSIELEDYFAACAGLITQASKRALFEAEAAAKAFGEKIKGVRSLTPSCSAESGRQPVYMMQEKEAAAPLEPGGVNVRATVNAVFYLE